MFWNVAPWPRDGAKAKAKAAADADDNATTVSGTTAAWAVGGAAATATGSTTIEIVLGLDYATTDLVQLGATTRLALKGVGVRVPAAPSAIGKWGNPRLSTLHCITAMPVRRSGGQLSGPVINSTNQANAAPLCFGFTALRWKRGRRW